MPAFVPSHSPLWLIKIRKCLYWVCLRFFSSFCYFSFAVCFCKTFIGEDFELPAGHVAATGSGRGEPGELSVRACAPLLSGDTGCWWVTRLSLPSWLQCPGDSHDAGHVSPRCAAATDRLCLSLGEFSSGFELLG